MSSRELTLSRGADIITQKQDREWKQQTKVALSDAALIFIEQAFEEQLGFEVHLWPDLTSEKATVVLERLKAKVSFWVVAHEGDDCFES